MKSLLVNCQNVMIVHMEVQRLSWGNVKKMHNEEFS